MQSGLAVNGKELEIKDQIREDKADVTGILEMKLVKEIRSGLICPEG